MEQTRVPLRSAKQMAAKNPEFTTQEKRDFRKNWPAWMKQLPRRSFNPLNPGFHLIDRDRLLMVLREHGVEQEAIDRIYDELDFLDLTIMRYFRACDYRASYNQNLYRKYQIYFSMLMVLLMVLGGFAALAINDLPNLMPFIALFEVIVAIIATYYALTKSPRSTLNVWLVNRTHTEALRREYFRYLMDLYPYRSEKGIRRKRLFVNRITRISQGSFH